MKRVVLLSHCVLNHLCELPEASSAFRKAILDILQDKNLGMIQLPCPELCYQSLDRTSILPGDAAADQYRHYCKVLLEPVFQNLKQYQKHGISLAGIVGIDTSPSCSVANENAIMAEILLDTIYSMDIEPGLLVDMPIKGNGKDFLEALKTL